MLRWILNRLNPEVFNSQSQAELERMHAQTVRLQREDYAAGVMRFREEEYRKRNRWQEEQYGPRRRD